MNKTLVVVGSQWGDEGKGKITNYLSENVDFVVRYQGGDNAGHTIKFGGITYKLHLIPSGVFNPKVTNILGNGMVINVRNFLSEISHLQEQGFSCENVFISDRAHVLFDYHVLFDGIKEESLGLNLVGTTKKGIGPAYTDKIARDGIRIVDFISEDFFTIFKEKVQNKNRELIALKKDPINFLPLYHEYQKIAEAIAPFVVDGVSLINQAYDQGKRILFEGAQGALLDVDFGSYPFVTSSNPSAGGVCIGSGLGPTKIDAVLGVVKAYSTRVGSGCFPTEFEDETAKYIRETGNEYGTTTKRPRRIGWFDGVVIKYSKMINGLTGISLMLLDVLTGIDEIKICSSYKIIGKTINTIPSSIHDFEHCVPVYEELPGWKEDISQVKSFDELPENAKNYIRRIEAITGLDVQIFSVGPDKTQTIVRKELF
ncbi:MAG: adenylosuccinate synthase [Bacilli bacterium]